MKRENKSRYAVLGILSLRPMSGYDIKKTIRASLSNFWSESYGQIYPILRSLVEDGLATISVETQRGKPNRHVYALTEAGRKELERWLRKPVEHEVGRSEILLKLFFGWQMPAEESLRKVEQFRELQQQLLHKYEAIEPWLKEAEAGHPGLPYWLMTVSYGKHISRALTDWCDETLAALHVIAAGGSDPTHAATEEPDPARGA
jgi:DNA-binding PadR family transcriptional regulator